MGMSVWVGDVLETVELLQQTLCLATNVMDLTAAATLDGLAYHTGVLTLSILVVDRVLIIYLGMMSMTISGVMNLEITGVVDMSIIGVVELNISGVVRMAIIGVMNLGVRLSYMRRRQVSVADGHSDQHNECDQELVHVSSLFLALFSLRFELG